MLVYEKIYFEVYTNDQFIWHKNNIAQLYFILTDSWASLRIFPVDLGMHLIFTDFQ